MDLLNHRLGGDFLNGRIDHYADLARAYGTFGPGTHNSISLMRSFVRHRADFMRRDLQQFYGAGAFFVVRVKGPPGLALRIDGQPARSGYRGVYFAEYPIRVELAGEDHPPFLHWRVDGEAVEGRELVHRVTRTTLIEPVFAEPF